MSALKRERDCDGIEQSAKRSRLDSGGGCVCSHDNKSKLLCMRGEVKQETTPPIISVRLLQLENEMCRQLETVHFSLPITHTYNPLSYASDTHSCYVRNYGNSRKKVLFLGMNPGPFGMAQNGVPFGDAGKVSGWLKISGEVNKPLVEHPKRPILGMENRKNEVSGTRFWTLMEELCTCPEVFFENCYVHNYCPFCFMSATGKNITPPTLRVAERRLLEEICDHSLLRVFSLLGVEHVVAVGKYAVARATAVAKRVKDEGDEGVRGEGVRVHYLMHPSPINPAANKNWTALAVGTLRESGVLELVRGGRGE